MSDLRTRIVNTISVTHEALPDQDGVLLCACGMYFDHGSEHGEHVADAVIRELETVRRERINRQETPGEKGWAEWDRNNH
jgi:hypothetical protein